MLVHLVAFAAIKNQPRWFAEGLANFFETINVDPDKATGDVGKPNPNVVMQLRHTPPLPSAKVFACNDYACMDDNFYATSWMIFAYLANARPKELVAFTRRIDELPEGQWQQAWSESFPGLTTDALDHETRKWLAYGKHTLWKFTVELKQWPVTERSLRDADVLATRALLRQRFAKPDAPRARELEQALVAEPTHLLANLVKAEYDKTIDLAVAKKVAEAHPDDWRSWWLVGLAASWQGDDARAAWENGCMILGAPAWWCRPGN